MVMPKRMGAACAVGARAMERVNLFTFRKRCASPRIKNTVTAEWIEFHTQIMGVATVRALLESHEGQWAICFSYLILFCRDSSIWDAIWERSTPVWSGSCCDRLKRGLEFKWTLNRKESSKVDDAVKSGRERLKAVAAARFIPWTGATARSVLQNDEGGR